MTAFNSERSDRELLCKVFSSELEPQCLYMHREKGFLADPLSSNASMSVQLLWYQNDHGQQRHRLGDRVTMACLDHCECAHQVDLQNLPKFINGLVHQHCMIRNAGIIDESCQRLPLQLPLHLHTFDTGFSIIQGPLFQLNMFASLGRLSRVPASAYHARDPSKHRLRACACCAASLMASTSVTSKSNGVKEDRNSLLSRSMSCSFRTLPNTW